MAGRISGIRLGFLLTSYDRSCVTNFVSDFHGYTSDHTGHGGQDGPAGYPVSDWDPYYHPMTGHVTNLVSDLQGNAPDHAGHGSYDNPAGYPVSGLKSY